MFPEETSLVTVIQTLTSFYLDFCNVFPMEENRILQVVQKGSAQIASWLYVLHL